MTISPELDAAEDRSALPTLVSFYAGDRYYYDAAESLRADCERLGMPHHIEELPAENLDWGAITRLKIDFYRRMHAQFGAILWVDVDTRLVRLPRELAGGGLDLVGFGGRYQYIRNYDPFHTTRFWVPSFLYFGNTPGATDFLNLMGDIEAETTETVTDDYVLHEAWLRHEDMLNVGFLAPDLVARPAEPINEKHVFVHGDSGNVSSFRGKVAQHQRSVDNPVVRARVFCAEAVDAMKAGSRADAVWLSRRALATKPDDSPAAIQLSRYLKIVKQPQEALEVLEDQLADYPQLDASRLELVSRLAERRRYAEAREQCRRLMQSEDPTVAARARSTDDDVAREERAAAAGLSAADRPRMWWMKTPYPGNFGDVLSPWMVEWVTGKPPVFGQRGDSLLAIGSVIKFATAKSMVWGAGTPRRGDPLSPEARYVAVRGPITREEILANGGDCPEVYGDAGLLLPRYIPAAAEKTHEVGFIRHVTQENLELELEGVLDIRLAGVGEDFLRSVVEQITSCRRIISTSLHGVIVANAYGIPARWAVIGDASEAIAGDGTKFEDYFRSVGLELQTPLELSRETRITPELAADLPPRVELDFDAEALINALRSGLEQ
ncbi:polysaccharide pyruvyl transferase family protein [Zhihengliuella flava]|uniref:Polysaccharide pyruvyl transferase domain-containing protein n=1 Tax=Zhihengliuella flava TaxID=1285193 RepID=A0A931DD81_9MICC|nr:polysaccharide pyruvyl transferase family protein [Zhihengliuella flava]MBG6085426.1 hypothetical protein [Zhihengliuella flava]